MSEKVFKEMKFDIVLAVNDDFIIFGLEGDMKMVYYDHFEGLDQIEGLGEGDEQVVVTISEITHLNHEVFKE